ncbi:MAG: S1 RNA-binding domain-containing protein [Pirellula sp.]|nr:S1 RNA-binding domain-containing protein [Pirellula sp.]
MAENEEQTPESPTTHSGAPNGQKQGAAGPLNLEAIRRARMAQEQSTRSSQPEPKRRKDANGPQGNQSGRSGTSTNKLSEAAIGGQAPAKGTSEEIVVDRPDAMDPQTIDAAKIDAAKIDAESMPERYRSNKDSAPAVAAKVPVPTSRRRDQQEDSELAEALEGADLEHLMIGEKNAGRVGVALEIGNRYQARVIKVHNANVFVSLGGPNEGVVPLLQFLDMPTEGQQIDVMIRSFNAEEGLYELGLPGEAVTANDWADLEEGAIVEAKIESANSGGVECKVGNIRGFIPMSQLSEYRIESAADYIGQKLLCLVTEANQRRGNLVLSHRSVLEREKQEKKQERLATLEIGQLCEGTVRKLMDFGAFVDIGGLDGLIHITQLSWEKIKHPSEVLNEGDKVQVRIEKFDPKTAKISLSYRSLQDDPWSDVEARFPVGSTVKGAVSRLAEFGAFVKLSTGIEGLIHISELAHRRVSSVSQVLAEGQEVEVKILSVDQNAQRIGLSLKATQAKPGATQSEVKDEAEPEIVKRDSAVKKFQGPLRGGTGPSHGGDLFGLKL